MPLSSPPVIRSVEAFPLRLPRDFAGAKGTAGSPTALGRKAGAYRWSAVYPALYSENFETVLVRVQLDDGTVGWGEAQAPVAPRVAATIIEDLLAPVLEAERFDGGPEAVEELWWRMYRTMRVRGQTSGFMLDAISGVDLALWDLAGKLRRTPVARMLAGPQARTRVAAYLSGLAGADAAAKLAAADEAGRTGFPLIKVFFDRGREDFLAWLDTLAVRVAGRAALAVDALWRLDLPADEPFLRELEGRRPAWLECPFPPDELDAYRRLAAEFHLRVAVGESYRTLFELDAFLRERLASVFQPDLGRCGLTGALRIARAAARLGAAIVPHVSIALGPQIAAAVHFAAAVTECEMCEYNPHVLEIANAYLVTPLAFENAGYAVPQAPGLGAEVKLDELLRDAWPA